MKWLSQRWLKSCLFFFFLVEATFLFAICRQSVKINWYNMYAGSAYILVLHGQVKTTTYI